MTDASSPALRLLRLTSSIGGMAVAFVRRPTPAKVWIGIFAFWSLLLTGFMGSPGLHHAFRLGLLLNTKEALVQHLQSEIKRLHGEAALLEKSRAVQQREIRRVLGYAAPDELIFDFSGGVQP